jgi:hypothetical protein
LPDALRFSRQNRKLRKQLFFYDFSVEPKAREGRAFPSHGREVQGSIPCASTSFDLRPVPFTISQFCAKRLPDLMPMPPRKLTVLLTTLTGGAVGLFAPVGVVKWLLQTEPEDAGILTLFFFPVWCLIFALGLLIGRRLGMLVTGGKRVLQR